MNRSHHSPETKAKMRLAKLGKPLSDEHKAKLSANHRRYQSEETRAKLRESRLGEKNYNWKGDDAKPEAGRARAEKLFPCPKGMERHHIDGNPLNNAKENIQFVTRKEHQILDGRIANRDVEGRFK